MITKNNYLVGILQEDHLFDIEWYYSFLAITDKINYESKYLKIKGGSCEVLVDNKWIPLMNNDKTPFKVETTVFEIKEEVELPAKSLPNLSEDIKTTVGRMIMNKILLAHNFGPTIPYINNRTSIKDIENIIAPKLASGAIKVSEYVQFADSVTFLRGLTRITNVSATYKNILPPPNLKEHKERIKKEFDNKYGPNWVNERVRVVEFQEELKKIDAEWLKGDPTEGRLLSGKIRNNARVKMFLTFGPEVGFDKSGNKMTFVENSLLDGYPEDPKQLTAMFNSSRSGSYDRGKETQKGGAVAKDLLRATSAYHIHGDDCGATKGKVFTITKDMAENLQGRYMIVNGKTLPIENPESLIGKSVELRSPMYCINKDDSYCEKCVGERMSTYKTGVSLKTLDVSMTLLTLSLKSIHNSQVKLCAFNIRDTLG